MLDRIRGMLYGVALGDALGAPYEFNKSLLKEYDGKVDREIKIRTRYQGTWIFPVGSVTDDTEMTLALAGSIARKGHYDRNDVIASYMKWANAETKSMGKNTRQLFKNVKTLKGYQNRFDRIAEPETLQSNGALMRCAPLALFGLDEMLEDVWLTNPNLVAFWTNFVYINAVKLALGGNKIDLRDYVSDKNIVKPVRKVLRQVLNSEQVNVTGKDKGWCCHALYVALKCFLAGSNFAECVDSAVKLGGDTDTNAAITGALAGAYYGYDAMTADSRCRKNIQAILTSSNVRPNAYLPRRIDRLAEQLSFLL